MIFYALDLDVMQFINTLTDSERKYRNEPVIRRTAGYSGECFASYNHSAGNVCGYMYIAIVLVTIHILISMSVQMLLCGL